MKDIHVLRHSAAHILAQAVQKVYGEQYHIEFGIGPEIENGFYYDFLFRDIATGEMAVPVSDKDLPKIEKMMKHIIKQNQSFEAFSLSKAEALSLLEERRQPLKMQIAQDIPEETLSFYRNIDAQGRETFLDMCAGPHCARTVDVPENAIMLDKTAGAYFRGDSNNVMMVRIYGLCFETAVELQDFIIQREEAKKRDHKLIGDKLDLFHFEPQYAPGFPFIHEHGMRVINTLLAYWRETHRAQQYQEIRTPIVMNRALWETSGHWFHYRENMYTTEIDEVPCAIKPMNCPGSVLSYGYKPRSYRDLPVRMGEFGVVHRHEFSGTLNGLFRVRAFTQDDAHIFCTPDQIQSEVVGVMNLIFSMYKTFGFDRVELHLSTRPTEGSVGTDEIWQKAEKALENALVSQGLEYKLNPGDGAFYGPKIDFKVFDALGRPWQCATVQVDFNLPERFDIWYTDSNGEKQRPVMLHRVVYGSIERFFGILIEHYAGSFPLWLAPRSVAVCPVADAHTAFAENFADKCRALGLFVDILEPSETLGKRVRTAETLRYNYIITLGEEEVQSLSCAVRSTRGQKVQKTLSTQDFITLLTQELSSRSLDSLL